MKKLFLISLFLSVSINAQNAKAFPTAKGLGAYARADVVYTHRIVTNLNDSGPGSFREACQPNSIVSFNVSGIGLNTNITYNGLQNVIILGQTAPEGGYEYGGVGMRAEYVENFSMRYVSLRNIEFGRDALDFIGANKVIIDHCSVSFGGDETMSFRASYVDTTVDSISVTNNHFNFGKTGMLLGDSADMTKSDNMSSIGNLWGLISHRHPNTGGDARVDAIGNVVYDFSPRIMVTIGSVELNEINNYYLSFDANTGRNQARIVEYTPSIYTDGNVHTGQGTTASDDDWDLWQNRVYDYGAGETDIYPIPTSYRANTMFPLMNFEVNDLQDADWWLNKATIDKDVGNSARLNDNGERVQQIQKVDSSLFARIDAEVAFPWTSALDYKIIPELLKFKDTTYVNEGGVIVNTHDPTKYTSTVANAWITANGMTPGTFDPMGHDLDATYTNIEMYSFEIDGATVVSGSPQNVQTSVVTQTSLTISWDAVTNATSYDVFRDNVFQSNVTNGETYNDSGLTAGTTYSYRIDAKDSGGTVLGSSQSLSVQTQAAVTVGNGISKQGLFNLMNN